MQDPPHPHIFFNSCLAPKLLTVMFEKSRGCTSRFAWPSHTVFFFDRGCEKCISTAPEQCFLFSIPIVHGGATAEKAWWDGTLQPANTQRSVWFRRQRFYYYPYNWDKRFVAFSLKCEKRWRVPALEWAIHEKNQHLLQCKAFISCEVQETASQSTHLSSWCSLFRKEEDIYRVCTCSRQVV